MHNIQINDTLFTGNTCFHVLLLLKLDKRHELPINEDVLTLFWVSV